MSMSLETNYKYFQVVKRAITKLTKEQGWPIIEAMSQGWNRAGTPDEEEAVVERAEQAVDKLLDISPY